MTSARRVTPGLPCPLLHPRRRRRRSSVPRVLLVPAPVRSVPGRRPGSASGSPPGRPNRRATSARVSPSPREAIASSIALRRWAAGRSSANRLSSPRRLPRISAPALIIGLKSKTTAFSASPMSTASPSSAPSSSSRSSTPSRLSRSARKPTASSLLKSVCRTQRSGFTPRTRQPSPVSLIVNSGPPAVSGGRITMRVVSRPWASRPGWRRPARPSRTTARAGPRGSPRRPRTPCSPRSSRSARTISTISRPSGTSILLSATRRGRSSRPPYLLSSFSITSRSATGSRPGSIVAVSIDVDQRGAALDVAQEVVAEAAALARALDQPGHVGDGEGGLPRGDDAEVGHQRRERVVGDLRPGPRQRRDQAGLAGAGEADQADVGDDLELEDDHPVVAGLAEQREAGGLALGGGQRGVAETAAAALGDHHLGARADQVGEHVAALVADHGAVGHRAGRGRRRGAPLRCAPAPWPPCSARRCGLWW